MKKIIAVVLTLALAAIAEEAPAEHVINYVAAEDLAAYEEMEFDPNEEYDIWTIVDYTIEDIQADLVCTVSAKADFYEFYQECNFYGDDQMTRPTWDGETYEVLEDKTGFMAGDTPAILDIAIEHNLWVPIEKQVAIPPDAQGRSSFRPCSYMSYIKLAPSFFRKIQSNLFPA